MRSDLVCVFVSLFRLQELVWVHSIGHFSIIVTCFTDPLKISFEGFREVLSHTKLPECFSSLYSGSLVAKFSKEDRNGEKLSLNIWWCSSPAENTEDQIKHEEWTWRINVCPLTVLSWLWLTYHYQRYKVRPVPVISHRIICLEIFPCQVHFKSLSELFLFVFFFI